MIERLRVGLRDGRVYTLRFDSGDTRQARIEDVRRSFENCMAGRIPHVILNDGNSGAVLKIYSDEITRVG